MDKLIKELREIANELDCEPHNGEILQAISKLKENSGCTKTERHADAEYIAHLEAKLAEYEKQEPVAWQHAVTFPDGIKYIGVISKEPKHRSRPLYTSPVPMEEE